MLPSASTAASVALRRLPEGRRLLISMTEPFCCGPGRCALPCPALQLGTSALFDRFTKSLSSRNRCVPGFPLSRQPGSAEGLPRPLHHQHRTSRIAPAWYEQPASPRGSLTTWTFAARCCRDEPPTMSGGTNTSATADTRPTSPGTPVRMASPPDKNRDRLSAVSRRTVPPAADR